MNETELNLELGILLAKAGVLVPADRMPAVLAGYQELRQQCALLRQQRGAGAEPSNTYSLVTLMKDA